MSSSPKRPRRSARLLAKAAFKEETDERPRKKARPLVKSVLKEEREKRPRRKARSHPPPLPRRSPRNQTQQELSMPVKPNLLSLPDEPLTLILLHMGAADTTGSFRAPRHAFSLAQTNSRLFRLFSLLFTHIVPDVSNPMPATLSPKHFLATTRLAGQRLRELVLPQGCCEVLAKLPNACPSLQWLSFVDDPSVSSHILTGLARLNLRFLGIKKPSRESIRMLAPRVQELRLKRVSQEYCEELIALLRNPPKKLHLDMITFNEDEPLIEMLLTSLTVACPKMEWVKISIDRSFVHGSQLEWEQFGEQAAQLFASVRQNEKASLCKTMKLKGARTFRLLEQAHPQAALELSSRGCTFGDEGDGFHVLRQPLIRQNPMFEMSRVREMTILEARRDRDTVASWKKVLKNVVLQFARVEGFSFVKELGLITDTVEIPFWRLCSFGNSRERNRAKYWNWLSHVREVRLVKASHMIPRGGVDVFLRVLSFVLDECRGQVLWIEPIHLHAKYQKKRISKLRPAFRAARAAVKRFEDRGGDAGTVRALLSAMRWTGTPDSS